MKEVRLALTKKQRCTVGKGAEEVRCYRGDVCYIIGEKHQYKDKLAKEIDEKIRLLEEKKHKLFGIVCDVCWRKCKNRMSLVTHKNFAHNGVKPNLPTLRG